MKIHKEFVKMMIKTGFSLKILLKRQVTPPSYSRLLSTCSVLSSKVQLTSERYPNLKRGNYASLTDEDIKSFQTILDPGILS